MEILQKGTIKESDVSFECLGRLFFGLLMCLVYRLRNDLGRPMIARAHVVVIECGAG